jgi:acyl carrier protein
MSAARVHGAARVLLAIVDGTEPTAEQLAALEAAAAAAGLAGSAAVLLDADALADGPWTRAALLQAAAAGGWPTPSLVLHDLTPIYSGASRAAAPPAAVAAPAVPMLPPRMGAAMPGSVLPAASHAGLVRETVAELLGCGPDGAPAPGAPLAAAGLNSAAAVELASRLSAATALPLPPTLAFDCGTMEEITAFLDASFQAGDTAAAPAAAITGAHVHAGAALSRAGGPYPAHLAVAASMPGGGVAAAAATVGHRDLQAIVLAVAQEALAAGGGAGGQLGATEPLMAAGLTSLAAVGLTSSLESRLGLQLPATLVFDHPSVAEIASYLATQLPADVAVAAGNASDRAALAGLVQAAVRQVWAAQQGRGQACYHCQ